MFGFTRTRMTIERVTADHGLIEGIVIEGLGVDITRIFTAIYDLASAENIEGVTIGSDHEETMG